MAVQPRIEIVGMRDLRRDLRGVDRKLPTALNRQLKRDAEPIRRDAAALAPKRTGTYAKGFKVAARGSKVVVYNRTDGAGIIHEGGRHPLFGNRDHWYSQPADPVIDIAARRHINQVERDLARTVEGVMRDAGFK